MQTSAASLDLAHPDSFYIDGAWLAPSSHATFPVVNASTEEVVAQVAKAQPDDVARAVAAARQAFDRGAWPRLTHAERARYLNAIAAELERRTADFARVWATESGVLYKLAESHVGRLTSGSFNYYASLAETYPFEVPHRSTSGHQGLLVREPVGVVAAIIPWNGPGLLIAYKCAPALLAGCTIVLKASPEAPGSAYLFAEICEKVGLPPGVVNVLTADRSVSEGLVRDPRIDKVTFTGSTAAGRKIASICGDRIARCTLELGGKSPAVVLDDYDIGAAAQSIASGCGYLTGQVCHSLTRVIVTKSRHDDMVDALCSVVEDFRIGDAFDPASDIGPLASAAQRDRVEGYIAKGVAEGARLVAGGRRPSHLNRGYFIQPTIFGDVDNHSTIGREEIFGPVLSVIAANDEQHAVEIANDTIYGLNAAVFTNDMDLAYTVARELRAGSVGHNGSHADFGTAFGGFKQSGLGREGGTEGLLPFLESKTIVLDKPFAESLITVL
jgi:betaine-aldehyde dehydrogenase